MEITALVSGGASAITGLLSQGNGTTYGIAVFLLLVIGILAAYKLFNLLMKVVTIAVVAALAPFALNLLTATVLGFELFIITSNLIISFMFLGVIGYTIFRLVYWVLGLLEAVFGAGRGYVGSGGGGKKKHKNDDEG